MLNNLGPGNTNISVLPPTRISRLPAIPLARLSVQFWEAVGNLNIRKLELRPFLDTNEQLHEGRFIYTPPNKDNYNKLILFTTITCVYGTQKNLLNQTVLFWEVERCSKTQCKAILENATLHFKSYLLIWNYNVCVCVCVCVCACACVCS